MITFLYITQLPENIAHLERHLAALQIAEGFKPQDKKALIEKTEDLLAEMQRIMDEEELVTNAVNEMEVFSPQHVN